MKFQFDSFAAFLHMEGHGFYVWLAYAIALVVVIGILVSPLLQQQAMRADALRARRLADALAEENQAEQV